MEIIAAVAVLGTFALFFLAGNVAASGTETAFTAYFRGWKPDPWPHGVQEEYIERPWGRDQPADSATRPGFERAGRDAGPVPAEIVDLFPTGRGQTERRPPATAGAAAAGAAAAVGSSADAQGSLLVQRVRGPHLRARL